MKFFALVLLACCLAAANAANQCRAFRGKRLQQFAGKKYSMLFPCKYHAVRNQVCGDYKVTVSPTNIVTGDGRYVVETLWLGVEELASDRKWEGRTSSKIAWKFLGEYKPEPFNTKFSSLGFEFADIFDATSNMDAQGSWVEVMAKNGDFRVRFGLYDYITKHRGSGFEFECFRDDALNAYPDQMCGDDEKKSIKSLRTTELGVTKPIQAILFDVFANPDNIIAQPQGHCQRSENTFRERCAGRELEAIDYCWRIVGSPRHTKCLAGSFYNPGEVFWHCAEFVCSNFEVEPFCPHLAKALDLCPNFYLLTNKVKETCSSNLFPAEDEDMNEGARR